MQNKHKFLTIFFVFCLLFECYHVDAKNFRTRHRVTEEKTFNTNEYKNQTIGNVDNCVFVILRHVREFSENLLWERCYKSIRELYPDNQIVIIDDNSKAEISDLKMDNTIVIKSEFPGAGEILPYYYFLKFEWAEKMIFLHDSMFMKRKFYEEEVSSNLKFHWCFKTHASDVDSEIEKFLEYVEYTEELVNFNNNKDLWYGCFGVTSIIDLNTLKFLENKYSLTNLVPHIKTRLNRTILERIFAIIVFYEKLIDKKNCANSNCILNYPRAFEDMEDYYIDELIKNYPGPILKTWHGR